MMKPVFEYMNYRDFLRDYYAEKKEQHSFYSYRLFSQKAGFKSPNFLKLVVEGQRNLSKESVFKFCRALGLKKKESDYFENLVFFNQSKSLEEKNAYLTRLMRHRARPGAKKIEKGEFAYYSEWYHPVVRELAVALDFKDDFRKLGQAVVPAISAADAEKSVRLLLDLGFVKTDGQGAYWKTSASLTTGAMVRSVAIANYHKAMLQLASDSIERFGSGERDVESLTVSVSEETYRLMMKKAQDFLVKELLPMAEADKKSERVAQINVQIFPLSQRLGADAKGDRDDNA
ncbi:MAG: TIGR02147 family protein [Chitinivibrionales bacterium]|nr:TIGR02147 family protein [Chitinivibrionales bacterium]MBD3397169.1 TIGR02147 family protein [Chitinivibrionales bacterium]